MSKKNLTNTERVELQRQKELEVFFKLDDKADKALKKEIASYPAPKIERHSGALRSRLCGGKP